jgi:hypothetical protein
MPSSLAVFGAIIAAPSRRGGREAECARLEIWYTVYRIEGSNPSLSASIPLHSRLGTSIRLCNIDAQRLRLPQTLHILADAATGCRVINNTLPLVDQRKSVLVGKAALTCKIIHLSTQ